MPTTPQPNPIQPQDKTQKPTDEINVVTTEALKEAFAISRTDPVRFVDAVVRESIALSASDLFFEPRESSIQVRVRIDGVLYELGRFGLDVYSQVTSRIKVLCNLDPTEKRKVQEGQFTIVDYVGASVNLRVEISQTINGELIVIRVHKKETIIMDIEQLGFGPKPMESYKNVLRQRSGLVVACGPTGCGKTTTLYSTIVQLNDKQQYNVMTIEDPVEFKLEGVNQMQVQKEVGFTFAEGLRTVLRLSPDIVLVGEVRDKETAEIAVESGLTGQLVLSTLHAEDAVGAIFRLLDLGIESYLLNSSLTGVVAQRLVRKICQSCKAAYEASQEEIDLYTRVTGKPAEELYKSPGCPACSNLGFKGRMGIFEVLVINSDVRNLIREKVSETEMRDFLVKKGFITLLRDGLEKAQQGLTTVPEVLRTSLRVD